MLSLAGKIPRWLVLLFIAAAGVLLVSVPTIDNSSLWETIPRDIGIALVVVAILAFTIDRWMKDDFREDAVKATLQALIHPEFHGELQRIINYEFLCEFHRMDISIEPINEDEVSVTMIVRRHLRNISGSLKELQGSIHIDEWGFNLNKSAIEECSIEGNNGEKIESFKVGMPNAYSIKAETDKLAISHGNVVTVRSKSSEIRRKNDHFIATFSYPTKDPIVTVRVPADIAYEFNFGRSLSPGEKIERDEHFREHRLTGMYFPGFHMRARWWPSGWSVTTD